MKRRSKKSSHRRSKRKVGSYARFVQKHKSLFKRHSFGAANKKIASMWRKKN